MKTFFAILFILCSVLAFCGGLRGSFTLQLGAAIPALVCGLIYIREEEA